MQRDSHFCRLNSSQILAETNQLEIIKSTNFYKAFLSIDLNNLRSDGVYKCRSKTKTVDCGWACSGCLPQLIDHNQP